MPPAPRAGFGPVMGSALAASPIAGDLNELLSLRARTHSQHPCLERAGGGRRVPYAEVRRVAERWSVLLDDLEIPVGATVGLAVHDPVEFALVFLGIVAAGRVAGPLDANATTAELTTICKRTAPHVVVADTQCAQDGSEGWLTLPAGTFGLAGADEDLDTQLGTAQLCREHDPTSRSGGVLLSTSGTTGAPKLIRLGISQLLHTATAVVAHHELTDNDTGFNPLPLFHINAEVVALLSTIVAGGTVVLDDRFHRHGFWRAIARHRVTWINAVPAILARLGTLEPDETVPASVRFARSASAPLSPAVLARFERATSVPVIETYGMTEAGSQITANPLHGARKPGSVGVPAGADVEVRGDEGCANGVGRVAIRGGGVIRTYAGPGYDDRFDAEGWLDTGDLGYFDDDGYLFLVGRSDEVINRGGEKILPREVEEILLDEVGVAAAVVVAREHVRLGEVPVAYLVPAFPSDPSQAASLVQSVQQRCETQLSRYKRPAAYHVIERLPQSATGKIQRRTVAEGPTIYSLVVR